MKNNCHSKDPQKEHVFDYDATTKHAQTDERTRKFTQLSDIFQVQNLLIPQSLLKDTVKANVHGWKIEMVVVCIILTLVYRS